MEVRFSKAFLDQMETDPGYDYGLPVAVVTAYRKRMQTIRAAPNEHVLHALKSLRLEELEEKRDHQYSMRFNDQRTAIGILNDPYDPDHRYAMRLTDQYRLVVEFESKAADKVVAVVDMEDYHEEFDHAAQKDC
jgi:proteic killer suppression protein